MREKKWIIRGVYLSYISFFVRQGLVFILTPIMVDSLGKAAYGLWLVLGSVMTYFGMLNIGIGSATAKYTAEYHALNDRQAISKLASSMIAVIGIIGLVILFVCFCLIPFIQVLLNMPEELVSIGRVTFLIMAFNIVLLLLGDVVTRIIYGFHRVDIFRTFTIIQVLTNGLLTILLLNLKFGIIGVALAASFSITVLIAMSFVFMKIKGFGVSVNPRLAELKVIKEIAPYSVRTFVLSLTSRILYNSANIVIGIFLTVSHVTPYSIAYRLCYITTYLFTIITENVYPRFTKLYTQARFEDLRELFLKVSKLCMVIVVPIMLSLGVCGQPFINLWVGQENFIGMPAFIILIFFSIPHAVVGAAYMLLQAIGKNKGSMYSEIINSALNLSISIVLVRRIGLLGMAIGTLVSSLLSSFWAIPGLACKHIKLPLKRYLLSSIMPPLIVGIPASGLTWIFIRNLIPDTSIILIVLKVALIFLLYLALYLPLGATRQERRMYLRLFPKLVGFVKK